MVDDYRVGRGRPPLHARFVKGQSGNPKGRPKGEGRPKGSRSVEGDIEKALMAPCIVTIGGKKQIMSNIEALTLNNLARATKGDKSAEKFVGNIIGRYLPAGRGGASAVPKDEPAGGAALADAEVVEAWAQDLLERKARVEAGRNE